MIAWGVIVGLVTLPEPGAPRGNGWLDNVDFDPRPEAAPTESIRPEG